MICKTCGRTIANEEANFCEYCGASFRAGVDNVYPEFKNNTTNVYQNTPSHYDQDGSAHMQGDASRKGNPYQPDNGQSVAGTQDNTIEKPMTFGNWLMVMLLPFIPMVGTIAYLALLFMWAFGAKTPATRKNWARAMLVMLVVAFFFVFAFFGSATELLGSLGKI